MPVDLPEGDGLAARYPGDRGIEGDPAVRFADDFEGFEDDVVLSRPQKGNKWDSVVHTVRITQEPANVHSGARAMEICHEEPMSRALCKDFPEGLDTVHVRYYMKYHRGFQTCHHTGVILWALAPGIVPGSGRPNSATGVRPNGYNHFIAVMDTAAPGLRDPYGSDRPPGKSVIYCYHMDQGRQWGDLLFPSGAVYPPENTGVFGEGFVPRPDFTAELDRWYCYELMVKANTPGKQDGRVAFWVDGTLRGDFPNLRLRNVATLKVNQITVGNYSSRRLPDTVMWYDDVVVATSYIGPQTVGK